LDAPLLADVDEQWVRRRFEREFTACERLLSFVSKRLPSEVAERHEEITLMIFARTTLTYRAILKLCSSGYSDQAQMLTRSLFEDMVMVYWVSLHTTDAPPLVEAQIDHMRLLRADAARKYGGALPPDLAVLERRREELTQQFGRYGGRLWSGKTLFETLKEIEHLFGADLRSLIWEYHDIVHKYTNQLLHLSAGGLSRAVLAQDSDQYKLRLRSTPAALEGEVNVTLFRAFLVYGALCGLLIGMYSADLGVYREEFTRDLVALAERVVDS